MNINKYTEKAQEAILGGAAARRREGHPEILPEHLLSRSSSSTTASCPSVLRKMNVDPAAVARRLRASCSDSCRRRTAARSRRSRRACAQVTDAAEAEAERLQGRVRQHRAPAARRSLGESGRAAVGRRR